MGQGKTLRTHISSQVLQTLLCSGAGLTHLLDVHQLRLVDFGDGDVVLCGDGESALVDTVKKSINSCSRRAHLPPPASQYKAQAEEYKCTEVIFRLISQVK